MISNIFCGLNRSTTTMLPPELSPPKKGLAIEKMWHSGKTAMVMSLSVKPYVCAMTGPSKQKFL